jgi:hypothetical protein
VSPQGKKGNPAAASKAKAAPQSKSRSRLGLIVFGGLFLALFVIVGVAVGIGEPSVPDGAIAVVEDAPNGTITQEEFDRGLVQAASRQGLKDVPASDDPQYQLLADAAEGDLILSRWVLGEAEERGIEITDREIDDELETIKTQQFGCKPNETSCADFEKFLDQSGFTLDEARDRVKLQLVSDAVQCQVIPSGPPQCPDGGTPISVSDDEVETFYNANIEQFQQPASRDVRVILTKTEDEANQALAALGTDPSPKTWEKVAKKYSIDEGTKSSGGLRPGVTEGQSEPALDEQVFSAPEGELVGPFEGDSGFYVIEVEKITEASTTPLADASDQIRQTLVGTRQQQLAQEFQTDFQTKWVARTFCAEDYRIDRCSNAAPVPSPCTKEIAESQGCDAPVPSTKPIAPGSNGVFGTQPVAGLPQGPISGQPAPAGGVPPGLTPVPGGTAPPATAPQTAPQTAPPTTTPGG